MKRIGVITYHYNHNYGTMLQALATQRIIEKQGYEVEIIDYIQKNNTKQSKIYFLSRIPLYLTRITKYVSKFYYKPQIIARDLEFENFKNRNMIVGNTRYNDSSELFENPPSYDGYVVGSDQTWNPYVANNPDAFYLPFVKEPHKKGSYAPSVAVKTLTNEHGNRLKGFLKDFQYVSCREKSGAKLLESVLGREVNSVLDPTMLLGWEDWKSYSSEKSINDKYILAYFLGERKEHREFVKNLSKITGYKIVVIPISYIDTFQKNTEKVWCGPDGFLELVKNASYICTDSFHGTVFSINFNKQFFTFCKTKDSDIKSENSRLYDALDMFGLSNRLIDRPVDKQIIKDMISHRIDYSSVNTMLDNARKQSIDYLTKMLAGITEE